jgi:hypothetical protein
MAKDFIRAPASGNFTPATPQRMKSLNYRPVCDPAGAFQPWLHELRNLSGAYVIRQRKGRRVLYVGESHSGILARVIKRHFYPWRDDPERQHITYNRREVEIAVRLTPPASAVGAQDNLIKRLEPRDNSTNPKANNPF